MSAPHRVPGALSRWLPVVSWAAVISLLSSDPFSGEHSGGILLPLLSAILPGASPDTLHAVHAAARKLAHVVEYAVLGVLVFRALERPSRSPLQLAWVSLLLCFAFATADELHQSFVPSRVGSPWDVALDTAGAALGLAARLAASALVDDRQLDRA